MIPPPVTTGPRNLPGNLLLLARRSTEYKGTVLHVLTIASGFGFGYFYFRYLSGTATLWPMAGALAVFCVFSVIRTVASRGFWEVITVIFLEAVAMTGPFLVSHSFQDFSVVAVIIFLALLWGEATARRELEMNVELRFFRIARLSINKIITGAALMLVVLYLPIATSSQSLVSRAVFASFMDQGATAIRMVYPGFNPSLTVGAVARAMAENQASQNPLFATLSQAEQNAVIERAASTTVANINQSSLVQITGEESVENAAYDFLTATLDGWREHFGTWFFVGWVVFMFLIIRSVGALFSLAVSFVALVVFYLLVAMKIVELGAEARMKEIARL